MSNVQVHSVTIGGSTIKIPRYGCVEQYVRGDRVRIKDGYDGTGIIGFYVGKSNDEDGMAVVECPDTTVTHCATNPVTNILLAAAIEPYPYSREERIERAIEDFNALLNLDPHDSMIAALFAILDAGI